jgi:superfamily II DNA or RNA helicase
VKARSYQIQAKADAYAALRGGARTVLVCMPTGTGKGFVIGDVIKDAVAANRRVLAFVHREEIIDQLAEHAERATGMRPAIERAHLRQAGDLDMVVVGSVPSLVNRLDRFPPDRFDLLIYDEAHHALAETPRRLLAHFARAKVIGFTATPNRGDEKALSQVFDAVGYDMSIGDAIKEGWLVPIRTREIEIESLDLSKVRSRSGELRAGDLEKVMTEIDVLREAIEPAVELAGNRQALVFTVTRAHMRAVAETVRQVADERQVNLVVATVDGETPKQERREIMQAFRERRINWLVNVEVATEGFDAPTCDTVIMLRPTLSRALWMQMLGRGTRPLPGVVDGPETAQERRAAIRASAKTHVLVLDFAGNSGKHELASTMDLLGGDYSLPERKEAERILAAGEADDLLEALEMARARAQSKLAEARARLGDPFAMFGLDMTKDRWGRAPTRRQQLELAPLRLPRSLDIREANTVLTELQRRHDQDLAMYVQARLLAQLGHPIDPLRNMSRTTAARVMRAIAHSRWTVRSSWEELGSGPD